MDKIIVKGLEMYAFHGVYADEKSNGQMFVMDIECGANLAKVCVNDNIDYTVNYAMLVDTVHRVFTANSYNTIERAAQVVCDEIFMDFPAVKTVKITLKKPDAPIKKSVDYVAVEINRER